MMVMLNSNRKENIMNKLRCTVWIAYLLFSYYMAIRLFISLIPFGFILTDFVPDINIINKIIDKMYLLNDYNFLPTIFLIIISIFINVWIWISKYTGIKHKIIFGIPLIIAILYIISIFLLAM